MTPRVRAAGRRDRGQAVPLVLAVVAVVVVLGAALAVLGRRAVDAAAARTAADAAALAGAAAGEVEARAIAEANGAELVEVRADGLDTVVTVRVGDRQVTARARRELALVDLSGPVALARVRGFEVNVAIAAQFEAMLAAAAADGIVFGGGAYRSAEAQIALRRAHCGPTAYDIWEKSSSQCSPPTARPGRSMHELGLAVDLTYGGDYIRSRDSPGFRWLAANAATYGLFNMPVEPWHWSVNGR